jgi:hypothetical protein
MQLANSAIGHRAERVATKAARLSAKSLARLKTPAVKWLCDLQRSQDTHGFLGVYGPDSAPSRTARGAQRCDSGPHLESASLHAGCPAEQSEHPH